MKNVGHYDALMLDGIEVAKRTMVVAMGVNGDGDKRPLGIWQGSTENAVVCTALRLVDDAKRRLPRLIAFCAQPGLAQIWRFRYVSTRAGEQTSFACALGSQAPGSRASFSTVA